MKRPIELLQHLGSLFEQLVQEGCVNDEDMVKIISVCEKRHLCLFKGGEVVGELDAMNPSPPLKRWLTRLLMWVYPGTTEMIPLLVSALKSGEQLSKTQLSLFLDCRQNEEAVLTLLKVLHTALANQKGGSEDLADYHHAIYLSSCVLKMRLYVGTELRQAISNYILGTTLKLIASTASEIRTRKE
jgi:hypothetical protein